MSKIRLIALDLDGTTFNSEKKITKRTAEAIAAAIRQGVIVMPSTGRARNGLPESFTSIPGVRYALTSNGAAIWNLENEEIVYGDWIPQEVACQVVDRMLAMDAMVDCFTDGIVKVDRRGFERLMKEYKNIPAWFYDYVRDTRVVVDDLREEIYAGRLRVEKLLASYDDLTLRADGFRQMEEIPEVVASAGLYFNMEVNARTATKGNSILAFASQMGIRQDEIMACGDATNDRSMLEAAGLAVAMANSVPELLELADYVTLSNDEDGVAVAIEKFVL